ncbi:uncharacterized protein LOC131883456 [Tigriopus californicus]|uniref:uncharacterized protein LOC131883456 n=1 Tax=Tigriopus californicus TaxID=6832 RepID=UPI0027DA9229|nr:uncharacterized protein LOC131883456 [Tigriopus californicus]
MNRQVAFSTRIQPFTGDPLNFNFFIKQVEDVIERNLNDPKTRLNRLLEVVQDHPKALIEGCVFAPEQICYDKAKALLTERYGNVLRVANRFMEELRRWPPIKDNSTDNLSDFHRALVRCSSVVSETELDSPRFIGDLVPKLPYTLRNQWRMVVFQIRQYGRGSESFVQFIEFVRGVLDRAEDPIYGEAAIKASSSYVQSRQEREDSSKKTNPSRRLTSLAVSTRSDTQPTPCLECDGSHDVEECSKYLAKSMEAKQNLIRKMGACFGCLRRGHMSRQCPKKRICQVCENLHPTSLHKKRPEGELASKIVTTRAVGLSEAVVAMNVVKVEVSEETCPSKVVEGLALLDPLSSGTFATTHLQRELGISGPTTKIEIHTINGKEDVQTTVLSGINVQKPGTSNKVGLKSVLTRDTIPLQSNEIATPDQLKNWPAFGPILDEIGQVNPDLPVLLLIGANTPEALRPLDVIIGDKGDPLSPYAIRTKLGWSVMGPLGVKNDRCKISCYRTMTLPDRIVGREIIKDLGVAEMLSSLIEMDFATTKMSPSMVHAGILDTISADDLKFMEILEHGTKYEDGRYVVPLPFKNHPLILPESHDSVLRQAKGIVKKMKRNEELQKDYFRFMGELFEQGYAREVTQEKLDQTRTGRCHYIPHHAVYHNQKKSIRVVYNCANKIENRSINDELLTGPDLTNQLVGVLLRFRKDKVAFTADIEKMFYQVKVPESDMNYLRFFWFRNNDFREKLVEFEMTRHLFGGRSSPGCANYALKRTAVDHGPEFGEDASETVNRNFYVDDCLKSLPTVSEAVDVAERVVRLCSRGGFRLRKFVSNSNEFLDLIPQELRDLSPQILDLKAVTVSRERALGVVWNVQDDTFGFQINVKEAKTTQRTMLSMIASIYDPIGAAAPFLIIGRILLQETCAIKIGWDGMVPGAIEQRWKKWLSTLPALSELKIPRALKPPGLGAILSAELHSFGDGSKSGYGSVAYLRLEDESGNIAVSLVAGKARVGPNKPTTIPRMELVAAVLSATLSEQVKSEIDMDLEVFYWTDSTVVLGYVLNQERRFHLFVANRVQRILSLTSRKSWRYVDSAQNPADDCTRGLDCLKIKSKHRWFQGPSFLRGQDCFWRAPILTEYRLDDDDPELKREITVRAMSVKPKDFLTVMIDRYSEWYRLKRAVAVWLQFVTFLKARKNKVQPIVSLSVVCLQEAEQMLIKKVQRAAFAQEIETIRNLTMPCTRTKKRLMVKAGSALAKLSPFLDALGVLRVGGRLNRLVNESVNPVILPKKSRLTELIVVSFHNHVAHAGRGITMNALRQAGFWILGMNSQVRGLISRCFRCRYLRGKSEQPVMADLPVDRLKAAPPFTFVGDDFFGPFVLKNKRKDEKRYGVLFTCFSSRAIHLEVAQSLDTSSYIGALRRMISRRDPIRLLSSDNGLNFVGADREMKEALKEMDGDAISSFLRARGADYEGWIRNPHSASNFGGIWERQIRSIRSILASLMKDHGHILSDETFHTLICEVENIVNSRPLTVECLSDPTSPIPLNPLMMLTQKTNVVLPPPGQFQKNDVYCRRQWRRTQFLAEQFWTRFRHEYLESLQPRKKWVKDRENLQVGDIVLLKDENQPRNFWRLAKVVETYPDANGIVRSVKIRVGDRSAGIRSESVNPEYHRPVNKLVLLMTKVDLEDQKRADENRAD